MDSHFHINDFIFFVRQRSSDISIIREVIEQDVYRAKFSPHDVVVDIGAHIGSFSILAASQGTSIVAYEPVASSFALLKQNVDINGLPVKIFNQAVFGQRKMENIFVRDFNYGGSTFFKKNNPNFRDSEEVECITLDDVFEENHIRQCDFLKMDCEGSEVSILENFKGRFADIKRMAIEYHGYNNLEEIKNLIASSHNFTVTGDKMGIILAQCK